MDPTDLRPAKFRNIVVSARELGLKAGRRKIRDTVPGRDGDISEDLGRAAREYSIQFVCTGPDWLDTYNALIDAFEDKSTAEFIHPDGTRLFVVPDGAAEFSIISVGEATVSTTLIEQTDNRVEVEEDASAAVEQSANDSDLISADRLAEIFTEGAAAERAVTDVADGIQGAINTGKKACAEIALTVQKIETAIADILQAPFTVADYFTDLYHSITDFSVLSGALGRYHATELIATADYAAITDATLALTVQYTHELHLHCANLIVGQLARISIDTSYAAFDDAEAAVEIVAGYIDAVAPYSNSAQVALLADLQAQLVSAVLDTDQQLPRLKDFTPPCVMSADEIAQYLYQDGTRAAEIVARNNVQHPGFIGPDQILRVLEV